MTAEVDWVLDQLDAVVASVATDYSLEGGDDVVVRRVDRDDSAVYDGSDSVDMTAPIHKRKEDLQKGVYVGATYADRELTARGPGYDHNVEAVVGVRCEGLTAREYGHVDPDGERGVPFDEFVRRCRNVLLAERNYPSVGSPDAKYYTLEIGNEDPQSSGWKDFYRHSFDVFLYGEEDL